MSLPGIFSPLKPNIDENVNLAPAELNANLQFLADVLGLPTTPASVSAPAFSIAIDGTVSLTKDPTVPLGAATKQYADNILPKGFSGSAAGGPTAYTVTWAPAISAQADLLNKVSVITFPTANGANMTLDSGYGAAPIVTAGGVPVPSGTILPGQSYLIFWAGSGYIMMGADNFDRRSKGSFISQTALTLKWGSVSFTSWGAQTDTFSAPFVNSAFWGFLTLQTQAFYNNVTNIPVNFYVSALTTSAITIHSNPTSLIGSIGSTVTVAYLVLGY